MNWITQFFKRQELYDDLSEEIRQHIEERTSELVKSGMSPQQAARTARREFGNPAVIEERGRAIWFGSFFNDLMADIRVSLRVLRKTPGFAAVAVFTLALAIGANAVVFSVLNALILRPLNVPRAESLWALWRANETAEESYPDYIDLRDRNRSFESLIAWSIPNVGFDAGTGDPAQVWAEEASGNYFDGLGLQPYLGRFFHAADEHGANSVPDIVLSYDFWHTQFHDDAGVIGRVVRVNKHPYTIIGVAQPEFHGALMFFYPAFFVPLVDQAQIEGTSTLNDRKAHGSVFMVMGHLKSGVTQAQAIADLNSIGADLQKAYPKDEGRMTFTLSRPGLYGEHLGGPIKAFMAALMLLAGLILIAACANLGSLFAARATDRSREVALRLALGSTRNRVLRQIFTEAILISLAGGALGLWGSVVLLRGLSVWQPFPAWPIHVPVNPDVHVYLVALFLALGSGFLFGAVPVRQILHTNPNEIIKLGSTGQVGKRITIREVLLSIQIAICAVLVTSSLVAVRGLSRSLHSDFGFDPQNAMIVETDLGMADYKADQAPTMQKQMIDSVSGIPGVESVGLADMPPLGEGAKNVLVFTGMTADLRAAKAAAATFVCSVSPEYFRAARTAILFGRSFTWHDDKDSPRVAIVNPEFARKLFGSVKSALGGYFKMRDGQRVQVVGIAEQGKYNSLTEDSTPGMFLPILQVPSSSIWMIVRSSRDPQPIAEAIRSKLHDLDPSLPLQIQSRNQQLATFLFPSRMATLSLGVLGLMGAMLAITGIFGMAAYSISKRLRELGIRIALGARRNEVLEAALGRAIKLLAFGSAAGLLLGILASKVLAFIVYQATPRDPLVLAGVVFAMALLGLLATWIPAQRALSIDPVILLRQE